MEHTLVFVGVQLIHNIVLVSGVRQSESVIHIHVRTCLLSHFSCVLVFVTLWTIAHQAPLSMGFSRQEYWSGLPCSSLGDVSNPGIELCLSCLMNQQVGSLPLTPAGTSTYTYIHSFLDSFPISVIRVLEGFPYAMYRLVIYLEMSYLFHM